MTVLSYYRGRVALYAMLKALEIGRDDQVLLQAFTCRAVPEAIMACGARPKYVDIEENGYNMDADDLRQKITSNTKAIVIQHTYGILANMDAVISIAKSFGIPIIEDCCHTLASMYQGRPVGSLGIGSFYSFEWGKPIVAGIGGSLQINDPAIREKVLADYSNYRTPGFLSQVRIELQYRAFTLLYRPVFYWSTRSLFHWLGSLGLVVGNYNPAGEKDVADDFCLKMMPKVKRRLVKKLQYLSSQSLHSLSVTDQYSRRIRSDEVTRPTLPDGCNTIFARYPLLVKDKKQLLSRAREARVEIADWYGTPVHNLKGKDLGLVHYQIGSCPNAEIRCNEVISLPVHKAVTQSDVDRIVAFVNSMNA